MPSNSFPEDSLPDQRFQDLLVKCLEQLERGEALDGNQLLASYPEYASELIVFLDDQNMLMRIAQDLRESNSLGQSKKEIASSIDETIDSNPNGERTKPGAKIRYIGDYEILEEVARGGMGVVYKARQTSLKRIVALKMILAGQFAGEQDVTRFHCEAEAAANLDHPNIVPVFEVGEYENQHYFSMAFVDGLSLAQQIAVSPIAPIEAAELMRIVAEAIDYAHRRGVIHRDLKPANILLAFDASKTDPETKTTTDVGSRISATVSSKEYRLTYIPKITDFGLAKKTFDDQNVTATGQVIGTPTYMSPEQASGKHPTLTESSDVYSLGAILYCMLVGRPPFQTATALETLTQVVSAEPVPLRQLNTSIPRDLETICLKCLDKQPGRRYATAMELAEDLARFLKGEPIKARPITNAEKVIRLARRNPVVSSLLATTLALLVIAVAIFVNGYIRTSRALEIADGQIYGNQIALAAKELEGQHRNQAVWTLKNTVPERRGWEWSHLANKCFPNQTTFIEPDRTTQICLLERPYRAIGGRTVVTDGEQYEQLGIIFDIESGKEIKQLEDFEFVPLNSHQQNAIGFDPKAPRLLKLVDINRCEVIQTIELPAVLEPYPRVNYMSPDHFTKVAISPDGTQVVIVQQRDGPLHWGVWSVQTGEQIALHEMPWARFVDLSEGGERIAYYHPDGLKQVYSIAEVQKGTEVFRTLDIVQRVTNNAAVYRSGESIGIVSDTQNRVLYEDLKIAGDRNLKLMDMTPSQDNQYLAFRFFADSSNKYVFPKSVIEIWRCSDWQRQSRIEVEAGIRSAIFSPNNKWIVTPIYEMLGGATLAYWNVADGALQHSWRPSGKAAGTFFHVSGAQFNADSKVIAIRTQGPNREGCWSVLRTPGHEARSEFDLSQNAKRIAFIDGEDRIAILESFDPKWEPVFLDTNSGSVLDTKNNPIGPAPSQLTAKPPVILNYEQGDKPLIFPSPDGQSELLYFRPPVVPLLGPMGTGHLELRLSNGFSRKLPDHVGIVTAVAFSEDSRWIATASDDGSMSSGRASMLGVMADWESDSMQQSAEIKIWNASTGAVVATMRGHSGPVNDLAFSPDAHRLASASSSRPGVALDTIQGGQVIVWDPQSGQQLLSFDGVEGDFQCVAFSSNGNQLAAAGKHLVIWDGTPQPKPEAPQPKRPKVETSSTGEDQQLPDPVPEDSPNDQLPPVPPLDFPPTTTDARLALRQVTKANFDLLAKLPELERVIIAPNYTIDRDSKPPVNLPQALPLVKHLTIYADVDKADLQVIGQFVNLESISLKSFAGHQTPHDPSKEAADSSVDLLAPLLLCKHLNEAYLGNGVTDEQLMCLGKHPSLTSVSVNSSLTGEFLSSWDELQLDELRLNLPYAWPPKHPILKGLANLKDLQALSISGVSRAVSLESLDQLDELTSLELYLPKISDDDLIRATSRPKLNTLKLRASQDTISLILFNGIEFPESVHDLLFDIRVVDNDNQTLGDSVVLKLLAEKCPQTTISHFTLKWQPPSTSPNETNN